MRKYLSLLLTGAVAFGITPLAAFAQEEEEAEPVFHYLTVSTFESPGGEEGALIRESFETIGAPLAKVNPNVISYRVAVHNWGSNSAQVLIITEYADWAGITAECEECHAWFHENQPEEGTPEREEWDAMSSAFSKAFREHSDEIYSVNMDLAK